MGLKSMAWNWNGGYGAGRGLTASMQINFEPGQAVARVALSAANGGGLCGGGITQYRSREAPNGPDQDHNLGWVQDMGGYPPVVWDMMMTSVTAHLELGAHQSGGMSLMVWNWD